MGKQMNLGPLDIQMLALKAMQANLQVVVELLDALIEEKSSEAKSLLMLEAYFSKFGVLNFF